MIPSITNIQTKRSSVITIRHTQTDTGQHPSTSFPISFSLLFISPAITSEYHVVSFWLSFWCSTTTTITPHIIPTITLVAFHSSLCQFCPFPFAVSLSLCPANQNKLRRQSSSHNIAHVCLWTHLYYKSHSKNCLCFSYFLFFHFCILLYQLTRLDMSVNMIPHWIGRKILIKNHIKFFFLFEWKWWTVRQTALPFSIYPLFDSVSFGDISDINQC